MASKYACVLSKWCWPYLVGGFNHLEKIWVRQLGWLFPIYGKIIQPCSKPPTRYVILHWRYSRFDHLCFVLCNMSLLIETTNWVCLKNHGDPKFDGSWQNCHKWLPIPRNWDTSIFSYWWRKIPRCIPIKSNEQNPCVGLFPTTLPFNKNNQKSRKNELIHPEPLGWLAFWPGIHMSPPTGDSPSSFSPLPSRPRSVSSTLTFLGADLN